MRSTKETSRQKAYEVARGWEHVERNASNEAQVRKVLSEILERNTGQPLRTPTVRAWFTEWLHGKRDETKARYSGVSNAFFAHLGNRADRPLKDVTPVDVQAYVNGMKEAKGSDKTVALHLQALKSAFNFARKMQVIDNNPADPITVTVEDEVERELFSETEAKLLLDAAEGEWKMLLRLGYYTALRLSKAATLKWDAVDLVGRTIKIPKPGKRGRFAVIPIHDALLPHLEASASTDRTDGYVLPGLASADSGGKRGLSRHFMAIARKAGVDLREITRPNGHKFCKRSFHSFRHGVVSGLANKGVVREQRMTITGHKTEKEHGRYTHLEVEVLREAMNKLPAIPE
ncbi:MAG: site-specific integrase [Verrucomicrobia bacterium]|nr:site-specific integrase [Verrucomicrobiota bacterium]